MGGKQSETFWLTEWEILFLIMAESSISQKHCFASVAVQPSTSYKYAGKSMLHSEAGIYSIFVFKLPKYGLIFFDQLKWDHKKNNIES